MGVTQLRSHGRGTGIVLAGLVVVAAFLAVWASAVPDPPRVFGGPFSGTVLNQVPPDEDQGRPTSEENAPPFRVVDPADGALGAVVGWGAVVLVGALLLVVLALLVRALLRALARESTLEDDDAAGPDLARIAAALTADADERRAALGRGGPAEGVIAAWDRLEDTLRATGVALPASRTSTETAVGVLRRFAVDESALQTLAGLYREAAWSGHTLTEEHRSSAEDALARVDAGLAEALTGATEVGRRA
ncbi:DUF4129 domain-containing protein [Phycicoccus avicenniae]|uniref:DUF4129 domain-containing protein n=1 Tax=Phycicoccus avicenniae TaxID=2828860 RepID=UPI003D28EE7F